VIHPGDIIESLLHYFFPHVCDLCGTDIITRDSCLCGRCLAELPETGFEKLVGNPVERKFYGRLPVEQASAHLYFGKSSRVAELVHQVKYRSNRQLGLQLGKLMGNSLLLSGRFLPDIMIPIPLFNKRERSRGYNQSLLLCEGIAAYLNIPVRNDVILRPEHTETQTKKGRIERWKNIEGRFLVAEPEVIRGKHVLLVDDVITTGATIESCGAEILKVNGTSLSIATLCVAFS
jgi:ComF family protein